ncbi:hypothetical protein ACHAPU_004616 [Fusarium lateritium]
MFQPKEPFEDSETFQTGLIETVDGVSTLSSQCMQFAKKRPDDFVNYLRHAWEHEGQSFKESADVLQSLKSLKLNVVDNFDPEIQAFYLPIPKLVYVRNRYLLSQESFPFFNLQPEIPSESDLGPWAFLQDIIGNNVKDDLRFYINLLIFLKRGNRKGAVKFPRRVLELCLRIYALCDGASDVKTVRQWFSNVSLILSEKGWTSPSKCYTRAPKGLAIATPSSILFPPPKDWEVSDFEFAALEKFYKETLEIREGALGNILHELDKKPTDVESVKELYRALDTLRPELSKLDITQLKSTFKKKEYIFLPGNESPWYRSGDCVWGRQLKGTELKNPGLFYPELESFFVDVLGLPALDIGAVYSDLINLGNNTTLNVAGSREEHAKKLLVKLNDGIVEYGKFIDKEKLLQSNIFPVAGTDGRVRLCSLSTSFYIPDQQYLHDSFRCKVDLLDLDPALIGALEPFFLWADLKDRYLSKVIVESSEIEGKAIDKALAPNLHSSRVAGLLRIAVHFDSPRVATAADLEFLTDTLLAAKIHIAPKNKMNDEKPYPVPMIEEDRKGNLDIYMSNEFPSYSLALAIPRYLSRWLMTERGAEIVEQVDAKVEEYVKTVFRLSNSNANAIGIIFDVDGIVDIDELTNSPYLTGKKNEVSPQVPVAEPSPSKVVKDLPQVPVAEPSPSVASQVPVAKRKSSMPIDIRSWLNQGRFEAPSQLPQAPAPVPVPGPPQPSPPPSFTDLEPRPIAPLTKRALPAPSAKVPVFVFGAPSRQSLTVEAPSSQLKQVPDRGVSTDSSPSEVSQVLPQRPSYASEPPMPSQPLTLLQAPSAAPNLEFGRPSLVSDDTPSLPAPGQPLRASSAEPSPVKLFQGLDEGDGIGPSPSTLFQVSPRAATAEPSCPSALNPDTPSSCPAEAPEATAVPSKSELSTDSPLPIDSKGSQEKSQRFLGHHRRTMIVRQLSMNAQGFGWKTSGKDKK